MKPAKRVVTLVDRLGPVWQDRMRLAHWDIEHVYLDTYCADDETTIASTDPLWQYMLARVKWWLPMAVQHDDAELERVLVHELCHVLLAPVQSALPQGANYDLLELSTEMTSRAVLAGWT